MRSLDHTLAVALLVALLAACQSGAPIGTTCSRDSECSSPLVCRLGRCRAECAANRDCPAGARCLLAGGAGSCSLDVDDRCQSGGHVCPMGLTCLGDECVNTCMAQADCPPDALCSPAVGTTVSFCFAVGREDGGLVDDAGYDGGVAIDADQIDAGVDAGPRDADVADAGPCSGTACDEAIDLCVGDGFACAVRADHHVRCWGRDDQGQIGDGVDSTRVHAYPICISGGPCATPGTVLDDAGAILLATRVACGEAGACAVTTDGHVACWGSNDSGQAGLGTTGVVARAENVTALPSAALQHPVEVRAMRNVMCATISDATVWCWGYDNDDVLQIGMGDMVTLPVRTPVWDGMTLALGMGHICGLGADGTVICRGNHLVGELGPDYLSSVPPASGSVIRFVGATHPPSLVVAGQHFSCALVDGDAWCWGSNDTYSIGRATTATCGASPCQLDPQPVTLSGVDHLWAEGFDNLVCAQAGGTTSCWGVTDGGGGCDFIGGTCATPIHVPSLDGARQIEGGPRGLCAIASTGGVICFGDDTSGELGDGSMMGTGTHSDSPLSVCIGAACP